MDDLILKSQRQLKAYLHYKVTSLQGCINKCAFVQTDNVDSRINLECMIAERDAYLDIYKRFFEWREDDL